MYEALTNNSPSCHSVLAVFTFKQSAGKPCNRSLGAPLAQIEAPAHLRPGKLFTPQRRVDTLQPSAKGRLDTYRVALGESDGRPAGNPYQLRLGE